MYSHEIEQYIKLRQNLLTIHEYCEIIRTSPQIDHIKYEDNNFNMYTTDNYHYKIKIKEIRSNS